MATTSWRAEWNAISARIEGLVRAGECYFLLIQKHSDQGYSAHKRILLPESDRVLECLTDYRNKYEAVLPRPAAKSLGSFLADNEVNFTKSPNRDLPDIQFRLTALCAFRSQFDYHLAGIQDQIRTTAERAFLHLQRCIVADDEFRSKWLNAYDNKTEVGCERLGGVHLLWHGIWAFKTDAVGARTDLVMGDQIDNPSQLEEAALGMVLTEWKKAANESDVETCFTRGKDQASLYATGALGGVELADTRYVVVVTRKAVHHRDVVVGDVTYRFVNIAVEPSTPSVQAKHGEPADASP